MGGFFGGYVGPALTAATNVAGAYQGAEADATKAKTAQIAQQISLLRQQHNDEITNALHTAQTSKASAGAEALLNPKDDWEKVDTTAGIMLRNKRTGEAKPFTDPSTNQPYESPEKTTPPTATTKGYVKRDGTFMLGPDGQPLMPPSTTPTNIFTPGVSATGTPTIFTGHNKGDPSLTDTGVGKPQTLRIESATNTAAKARLEAAVSEMNNAHTGMAEYENALASGKASIHGLEQIVGRAGAAFTHDDPASIAIQSATLSALNRSNPDLARYIRRALSFAEGESMISQRPSDFRTKMSAFLSQAASGASPEMIHDIQSRRTSILTPLNNTVKPSVAPAHAPAVPAGQKTGNVDLGAPSAPNAGALWDAAVKLHGEAKVLAEYGPRPQGEE